MLSLDDSSDPLPETLGQSCGGFAWWYLDLLTEDGTSVVLIPSFGLPFLPGYASAARRGVASRARELPSLNIAVSHGDRSSFYLLQTYAPEAATWSADGMELGDSHFRSALEDGTRTFEADLDCPLPGTSDRLRGHVLLRAPAVQLPRSEPGPHRWTPLGVGAAQIDLRAGPRSLASGFGRAYHDRNGCPLPLHELGIQHWIWGRTPFESGELVHYLLWPSDGGAPRCILVWVDLRTGAATELPAQVELRERRLAWCGMPWWGSVRVQANDGRTGTIHHRAVVDDGPFYLRFHTTVEWDGATAHGVGEAVQPERVDSPWTRPFVSMAVHHLDRANSPWLPLFAGTRDGRVKRLLGLDQPRLSGQTS